MPFAIKNLNPPARFHYPNDTGDEWVELRNLSVDDFRQLRKKTTTHKVDYWRGDKKGKPHRFEVNEFDEDQLYELMWDKQIVDWNILDTDGNIIPCNYDNKLLMVGNSVEFSAWVVDCLNTLAKDELKKKEDLEKN